MNLLAFTRGINWPGNLYSSPGIESQDEKEPSMGESSKRKRRTPEQAATDVIAGICLGKLANEMGATSVFLLFLFTDYFSFGF